MNINAAFLPCRLSAVVLACLITTCAQAGSAGVANGDFDSDLSGWDLSGTPFPAWSMLDYTDNPGSGSAALFNAEGQANARVYPMRQCVALSAPGSYAVEADGFLAAGHVGGRLVVSYSSRAMADCSGGANSSGGYFLQADGTWVHGSATIVLNPGYNYLEILLGIEKDAATGLLQGNVDAVHVLDRDRIFANGFEVADLP